MSGVRGVAVRLAARFLRTCFFVGTCPTYGSDAAPRDF
jgi:hypothetical protein